MSEQLYTTDTAAERLSREVAEAVESGGRFSRAEFSVDDVSTALESLRVAEDIQRRAGAAAFETMYPLSGEPEGTANGDHQRRFAAEVARAALSAALGGGDQ